MRTSATRLATVVLALAAMASGCGSDDGDGGNASGGDSGGAAGTSGGATVTLTLDGEAIELEGTGCHRSTVMDNALQIQAGALDSGITVSLPGEPGDYADDPGLRVVYQPAGDLTYSPHPASGNWSLDGDTASGHLEGTTGVIGSSGEQPDVPFSVDFECHYEG